MRTSYRPNKGEACAGRIVEDGTVDTHTREPMYQSHDEALRIARSRCVGPASWIDDVASIMVTDNVPLWHACAAWSAEHGPVNGSRCAYCGEMAPYRPTGTASHALCYARASRGLPTPPIPYTVSCGCAQCGDTYNPSAYSPWVARARARTLPAKEYGR